MSSGTIVRYDRDKLATELYSNIIASYPENAPEEHYIEDSKYIISLLLRHLRYTYLDVRSLQRNSSFFTSFLKSKKYNCRAEWLKGMKKALCFFYPTNHLF